MNCPYCDNQESKVVDSRYIQDGIRRRRECLMCSLRFTTYEKIHSQLLNVIKRDNSKETFSVEKLTKSISTACKKRPISNEKIEKIAIDIETNLLQNHGSEISSNVIGQMVLNELLNLDKVSYIRFSSVYRDFQNEDSFVDEIDKLKTEKIVNAKDQMEMFPRTKKSKKRKGVKLMVETNKTNLEFSRYGETNQDFEPAPISDNAKVVLDKRYLLKDDNDEIIETPNQMFIRVAKALAKPEKDYGLKDSEVKQIENLFYQSMASLEFLPNSPTLMNAGTGAGTLSACFVLPLTDSMEGIMKAAHDAAMVQKFGGGTGFSLSEIRPTGTPIATTHGKACGPIAVLKHLSSVSTLVTQGGKRDGANMAVMDVHHPNILDFIECKNRR